MRILLIMLLLYLNRCEFSHSRITGEVQPVIAEANTNLERNNGGEMNVDNAAKMDSKEEMETSKSSDESGSGGNDSKDGDEKNEKSNDNDVQNVDTKVKNGGKTISEQEWKNEKEGNVLVNSEAAIAGKSEEKENQNKQGKELEFQNEKFYEASETPPVVVPNGLEKPTPAVENSEDLSQYLRIFPFLKPCSPDSIENFRALLRDPKLTKGELESRREKWAKNQTEDVKKGFMEWKKRLEEGKQKAANRIERNLASYTQNIQNLYQNLKAIIANKQISRHEECQQIRSLVNSTNSEVRKDFLEKVRIRLVQYCLTQKENENMNEAPNAVANPVQMDNQETQQIEPPVGQAPPPSEQIPQNDQIQPPGHPQEPYEINEREVNNNAQEIINPQNMPINNGIPIEGQQNPIVLSNNATVDAKASNESSVSSEEEDGNVVDESNGAAVNGTAPIWPNTPGMETTTWKPDPVPDPPKNGTDSSSSSSSEENLEKEVKEELEKEDKLDRAKAEGEKEEEKKDIEKNEKQRNDENTINKEKGKVEESSSSSSSSESTSSSSESGSSSSSSSEDEDKKALAKGVKGKKINKKAKKCQKAADKAKEESSSSSSSSSEEDEKKRVKKHKKRGEKRELKTKKHGKKEEESSSSESSMSDEKGKNRKHKKKLKKAKEVDDNKDENNDNNENDDDGKGEDKKRKKHAKRKNHRREKKEESNSDAEDEIKQKKHKKHRKHE